MSAAKKALKGLRTLAPKADAVFCSSDASAQTVLSAEKGGGIDVLGRVAILGSGNQSFALGTVLSLSTVHVDGYWIEHLAAGRLLSVIGGADNQDNLGINTGMAWALLPSVEMLAYSGGFSRPPPRSRLSAFTHLFTNQVVGS